MRKPGRYQKLRQHRIARKRAQRKRRHLKKVQWARSDHSKVFTVAAPPIFLLEARTDKEGTYRTNVLNFIRDMWAVAQSHGRVILDFSKTSKLFPAATLLFIAELEHMLEIVIPTPRVTCKKPVNVKVSHVFQQLGLYQTLNQKIKIIPFGEDVVHWRKASGTSALGEEVDNVAGNLAESLLTGMYLGITEAMTNVLHHAYTEQREGDFPPPPSTYRRWWMFSQERNGILTVAFCDLGIGIPQSLPKSPSMQSFWKKIVRADISDSEVISAATEESISRTKEAHRGKGLGQVVSSILSTPGGKVIIWSNKGKYNCENGKQPKKADYPNSVRGTVITWQLPVLGETAS